MAHLLTVQIEPEAMKRPNHQITTTTEQGIEDLATGADPHTTRDNLAAQNVHATKNIQTDLEIHVDSRFITKILLKTTDIVPAFLTKT